MNRNLNRRIHPIAEANGLSPKFHRKVKGKYGDYLRDLFQINKVSGIEDVSIAKIGGLERYYDYVASEWNKYYKDYMLGHDWSPSNSDTIHFIIGKVFEYNLLQNQNKENK